MKDRILLPLGKGVAAKESIDSNFYPFFCFVFEIGSISVAFDGLKLSV